MFFYPVLLLALLHLFVLSKSLSGAQIDENTKVLMTLSFIVALSVVLLGLLGHARTVTLLALAMTLPLYRYRHPIAVYFNFPTALWLARYTRLRPYPCLVVSISGLLCWAWYHP